MSADFIRAIALNPELLDEFRKDPFGTIEKVAEMTGADLSRITQGDIKLIQSFTPEEFQVFAGIADRMRQMNIRNLKL